MSVPTIVGTELGGSGPTLILGPSLGTPTTLWSPAAALLAPSFRLLAWDLPGHGASPATASGFTVAELADGVIALADAAGIDDFDYAGVSLGGQVGLALAIRYPHRVRHLGVLCSTAKIGSSAAWSERAAVIRTQGTPALVDGSAKRWFAPGFIERHPDRASALLIALSDTDDESYALCCEALGLTDFRNELSGIVCPTRVYYGEHDQVISAADAEYVARRVRTGSTAVVPGAAHLPPIEQPETVAQQLTGFFGQGAS
ncbi:MAG: alpha/beta fold hydrolase [Terrimesophilobacter sp.]